MKILKKISMAIGLFLIWAGFCLYGGLEGWWMKPVASTGDTQGFIEVAKQKLHEQETSNTALVLIENGEVVFEDYTASIDPIDGDTLFPLASMSKLFAAYGVMILAESGQIDLEQPVNSYLTRWQLPTGEFDNSDVTVARLLSHTSGLTDGLGFGEYSAEETLPSLEESLNNPRASSGNRTIQVGQQPGLEWKYSGGGYLILELLIEEVTGQQFEDWMTEAVFAPLGMSRSTYRYLGNVDNNSSSYDMDGTKVPLDQYASSAATGLSSSAADLTLFAKALLAPGSGTLNLSGLEKLRSPQAYVYGAPIWGLGAMLYSPTEGDFVFGHDGGNDPAINTTVRVNPVTNDGIIVLATGHKNLATTIASDWTFWQSGTPDFLSFGDAIQSALSPILVGLLLIVVGLVFWLRRN